MLKWSRVYNKMFHSAKKSGGGSDKKSPSYFLNKLVDHLVTSDIVKSEKVNKVMRKVDRGDFCDISTAY